MGGGGVSEFDEKLNSILNDPGSMAQIMQLAQSLSGGAASQPAQPQQQQQPSSPPPPPAPPAGGGAFEGFDPQSISRFLPLLREMQSEQGSSASQFLLALKPYLRVEKQEKVGRAIQIARLIRMGKHFFSGLEEG